MASLCHSWCLNHFFSSFALVALGDMEPVVVAVSSPAERLLSSFNSHCTFLRLVFQACVPESQDLIVIAHLVLYTML